MAFDRRKQLDEMGADRTFTKIPAGPTQVGVYLKTDGTVGVSLPKSGYKLPAKGTGPRVPSLSGNQQRKKGGIR